MPNMDKNQEQSPSLLDLNQDILLKIMERLELDDLKSLEKTCKQMNGLVERYKSNCKEKSTNDESQVAQANQNIDSPLFKLPPEILFEIMKKLDFMDIYCLRKTCKYLESVVERYKDVCYLAYMMQKHVSQQPEDQVDLSENEYYYEDEDYEKDFENDIYDDPLGGDFNEYMGYYGDDDFYDAYHGDDSGANHDNEQASNGNAEAPEAPEPPEDTEEW